MTGPCFRVLNARRVRCIPVVQRNYDITNTPLNMVQSTAYVNNVLYNMRFWRAVQTR